MAGERGDRAHLWQRFEEKANALGFGSGTISESQVLVEYTMETLALIEPQKAQAFFRILLGGEEVQAVAADFGKRARTVQRWIHGDSDELGAADWFLVIFELYREADCVHPRCAATLSACFKPAVSGAVSVLHVPFHRALFLAILEAFIGGNLHELCKSLPWNQGGERPVVAWPYHGQPPPLTRSFLPGLLAALQQHSNHEELSGLCLLILALANNEELGSHRGDADASFASTIWAQVLRMLNAGGSRTVAQHGAIPAHLVTETVHSIQPLLQSLPQSLQYAAFGLLSRTSLPRAMLRSYLSDAHFQTLTAPDDVLYCVGRCFGLT